MSTFATCCFAQWMLLAHDHRSNLVAIDERNILGFGHDQRVNLVTISEHFLFLAIVSHYFRSQEKHIYILI